MVNLQALLIIILSIPGLLLLIILTEAMTRLGTRLMQMQVEAHYDWPINSLFNPSCHVSKTDKLFQEYYNENLSIKEFKSQMENIQCVFCLCDISEGEEIRDLKCRHLFHRSCLDTWLEYKHATCPICRDCLLPADVEEEDEMEMESIWVTYARHGW